MTSSRSAADAQGRTDLRDAGSSRLEFQGEPPTTAPDQHVRGRDAGWRSPEEVEAILARRRARALAHFAEIVDGLADRECPICGYRGRFSPVRHKVDVWCPSCDSRSRHRLIQLWLEREAPVAKGGSVLHFAAEPCLRPAFEAVAGEYVTADLEPGFDLQLNIEAMALTDERFDFIMANHVLEHVDDARAFAEIRRVLKPGGVAAITAPVIEGWDTGLDEPRIESINLRRLVMSDPDHRRWYGRDIRDRIERAGFALTEFTAQEPDVTLHGLARAEKIFVCRKV